MNEIQNIRLTQMSHGSGCGCKIEPALLEKILNKNAGEKNQFISLIGGYETNDDAAVWDNGENYLLSTTDFFTPIVDDPFDFGQIAAANALSDIYAMGGRPSFALAILGFPVDKLPADVAKEIIAGAKAVCTKAGIPIAGGHSIDIPEPVFGLVVNGFVDKNNLKKNNTARENDLLFLTKPLGTGIIASAQKRGKVKEEDLMKAIDVMTTLNSVGAELGKIPGVHAMTDITGFGLLGHLIEMCEGSGLSAEIDYKKIPLLSGVEEYASQFIFPDNTYRNWNAYEKKVTGINGPSFITLCDPQTSGGLLIAVDGSLKNKITGNDFNLVFSEIGRMLPLNDRAVSVLEDGGNPQ
jgi:selenide,water dikinase